MENCDTNGPNPSPPPPNFLDSGYQEPHWAKQLQQSFQAGIERKARREHWLVERRTKQRDLAKKLAQQRRKVRTEQLAARRSSDPILSTGRRLAARTHAEARRITPNSTARQPTLPESNQTALIQACEPQHNTTSDLAAVHLGPTMPVKLEYESPIGSVPAWAELLAADPRPELLDWIETSVPYYHNWRFASKEYSIDEVFKVVADKFAIAEAYEQRMDERKVFERSMDVAMEMFRDAAKLTWRGVWTYTPFNILPPLPKTRPKKDRRPPRYETRWDRPSILAMALGLASNKELAIFLQEREEAEEAEEPMEVDAQDGWLVVDGMVITPYNVAWDGGWLDLRTISIEALNSETIPRCIQLLQAMTIDQLRLWRWHLTQLGEQGQGHVNKDKWRALNRAIGIQKKQTNNARGSQQQWQVDPWAQQGGGGRGFHQHRVKHIKVQKRGRQNNRGNSHGNQHGQVQNHCGNQDGKKHNHNRGSHHGGYNNDDNVNNYGNQQNQHGNNHHPKRGGHNGAAGGNNHNNNNNHPNNGRGGGGGGCGGSGGRGRGRGQGRGN